MRKKRATRRRRRKKPLIRYYTIDEALKKMKENPGLKMTVANHWRGWQYVYYDKDRDKYLQENDYIWKIELSRFYNEIENYTEFIPEK